MNKKAKTAWNPSGIAWLAFFFSFFPAGILYAINYDRLGKSKLEWPFIIGVVVAFLLVIASLFTSNLEKSFYQLINIIAALLFYSGQKTLFNKFLKEGGKKASFKLPLIFSILLAGLLIVGIYGLFSLQAKPLQLASNHFENDYITATIPKNWSVYKNEPGDTTTLIYLEKENSIANISIDHDEHLFNIPNSTALKNFSPKYILNDRLKSIQETIKEEASKANPDLSWTNFRRIGEIKEISFKGLPAAEGHFVVDERIFGGKTEKKIKRMVIFTDDDLYNIVFAATDINMFIEEEKEFNKFMNSLILKTVSAPDPYLGRNNYVKQECLNKNIDNIWYVYSDNDKKSKTYGNYGYKNTSTDEIMIPAEYLMVYGLCYDSTKTKGFTAFKKGEGIWYRKPNGEKIIQAFNFDSGPDYFREGLARYMENKKVGFINENLEIVIPAQFDWISSFKEGEAIFCIGCKPASDDEHAELIGGKWGKMNTKGKLQWMDESELKSNMK